MRYGRFFTLLLTFWLGATATASSAMKVLIFPRLTQSQPALGTVGYDNIDDYRTELAFTNLGGGSSTLLLTAFGPDGYPITGPEIRNPVSLVLPAGHQMIRFAREIFGEGSAGMAAWIEAVADGGEVDGIYFVTDRSSSLLSGAPAMHLEEVTTDLLLPLVLCAQYLGFHERTEIDVVNPNEGPVQVEVQLWAPSRNKDEFDREVVLRSVIPPRGKLQKEVAAGPGYLRVLASKPVLASETILSNTVLPAGLEKSFSLTVVNAFGPAAALRKPYAAALQPHVAMTDGWYTNAIFINPDLSARGGVLNSELVLWDAPSVNAVTKFFQVMPGQRMILGLSALLPDASQDVDGSLSYLLAAPLQKKQGGLVCFLDLGMTAIAADPPQYFRTLIPPVELEDEAVLSQVAMGPVGGGRYLGTGIVVRDGRVPFRYRSSAKNRINFRLYSEKGERLQTRTLELSLGEKVALPLTKLFPEMTTPQFGGYVRVSGSLPFQCLGSYWIDQGGEVIATAMIPQTTAVKRVLQPLYAPLAAGVLEPPFDDITTVPEPSTLTLLALGILCLAAFLRKPRPTARPGMH